MKRFLNAVFLLSIVCAAMLLYMNKPVSLPVSAIVGQEEMGEEGSGVTASELSGPLLLQAVRTVDYIGADLLPKPEGFDAMEDSLRLSRAAEMIQNSNWPFNEMPEDVPAYIQGTVRSHGVSAQGMYAVLESDLPALETYRDILRMEEYTLSGDGSTARKGERQIKLWHDGKISLYLSVSQLSFDGLWAADEIPDFLTPVPNKKIAQQPEILSQAQGLYSMRVQYEQVDENEAELYLKSLAQGLDHAELERLSVNGETHWNGRDWWVYAELYEQKEDGATFSYGWGIRKKE